MIGWPGPNTRPGAPTDKNLRPKPAFPATPPPVGTQDSPIVSGQKPQQVAVGTPAQPKAPRPVPFWEADWNKVRTMTQMLKIRQEVDRADTGKRRRPVEKMEYSDVVDVDFSSKGIQGVVHRFKLSAREGQPNVRTYVAASYAGQFPSMKLGDVAKLVDPENARERVPPGFDELGGVEQFAGVQPFFR